MKRIIIERPSLQSPLQRATTGGLTFIFWVIWIYLWLPLISLFAWLTGIKLFRENIIANGSYEALINNTGWYALIIFLIAATLICWSRYNLLRFRNKDLRKNPVPIDLITHAGDFKIEPQMLMKWQAAKYLVIHHDKAGDIMHIETASLAAEKHLD